MSNEFGEVCEQVRHALRSGDRETARLALHPYLHWQNPDGTILRGRVTVLKQLAETGVPEPPVTGELRDGQIYRWTCPSH